MDANILKPLDELIFEHTILKKLLYRNKNQHGTSMIFVHLQVLVRQIVPSFANDRTTILNKSIQDCLRFEFRNNQKVTEAIINKYLLTIQLIVMYIEAYSKAMAYGEKAIFLLTRQINRKLFPLLYAILYATTSKLLNHMYQVISLLQDIHQQLKANLQV
jgi:hypothetical protein